MNLPLILKSHHSTKSLILTQTEQVIIGSFKNEEVINNSEPNNTRNNVTDNLKSESEAVIAVKGKVAILTLLLTEIKIKQKI